MSKRTLLVSYLVILIVNMGIIGSVSPIHVYAPARAPTRTRINTSTHVDIPPNPPIVMVSGNQTRPEIALTFDDGPDPVYGPQIQNLLLQDRAPATFFYVGNLVARYPKIVAQAKKAGFAIGNHTWDHSELPLLSSDQVALELSLTDNAIFNATGVRPTFMRPPYGDITPAIEEQSTQIDLSTIFWDVDPQDWARPGTDVIVQRVLTNVHNGAIILMHEGGGNRSQSVAALEQIIPALAQRGYHFVTIPEMITNLHPNNKNP